MLDRQICRKIESLLIIYNKTKDRKVKEEIIELNYPRLKRIVERNCERSGLPFEELYPIALNKLDSVIDGYDYYQSKNSFSIISNSQINYELKKYHKSVLLKQGKIQPINIIRERNLNIKSKTNELLKEYAQTKDKKIKNQIIQVQSEIVKELANKLNYEDIPLETAYEIAFEVLDSSIEQYIELNNFNKTFNILYEVNLRNRFKSITEKYVDYKKLNSLLLKYNLYGNEYLREEIVQTYINRVYTILENYKDCNVPYEELLNVALESLRTSIEKFFNIDTVNFKVYITKSIIKSLNKYIATKSKEYASSDEIQKTLKI